MFMKLSLMCPKVGYSVKNCKGPECALYGLSHHILLHNEDLMQKHRNYSGNRGNQFCTCSSTSLVCKCNKNTGQSNNGQSETEDLLTQEENRQVILATASVQVKNRN